MTKYDYLYVLYRFGIIDHPDYDYQMLMPIILKKIKELREEIEDVS